MRIKEGYMLRETGDSRMVVGGATEDQLTDALLRTYRVDEPRARADVVAFLDLLADTGLLTD